MGETSCSLSLHAKEKIPYESHSHLGMDHGINYRTENFADAALKLTGGKGVDILMDVRPSAFPVVSEHVRQIDTHPW